MKFYSLNKLIILILSFSSIFGCGHSFSGNDSDSDFSDIDTTGIDTVAKVEKPLPPTGKDANIGDIFSLYLENKMAFNKKYEGKSFEFVGYISEITTSIMDCSVIRFEMLDEHNNIVGYVNCLNCPELVDKWKSKLMKLKSGDEVRIKGFYSSALAKNTMTFRGCTLIK